MDDKTEELLVKVLKEFNKPPNNIFHDYIRPIILSLTPVIIIGIYAMATYNNTVEKTLIEMSIKHKNDMASIVRNIKETNNKVNYNFNVIKDKLDDNGSGVNLIDVNTN